MTEKTIKLQRPVVDEGISVKQALDRRMSHREFSPAPLSLKHLSEILWAAYGINRADGRRTVPAAWGIYGLDVFAVTADGVYSYDPKAHELRLVAEGDKRDLCGMQEFVGTAPLNLLFFADYSRMHLDDARFEPMLQEMLPVVAALDAGAGAENVYLYCTDAALRLVERVLIDEEAFKQACGLGENLHFVVAQTIGYPPESELPQ